MAKIDIGYELEEFEKRALEAARRSRPMPPIPVALKRAAANPWVGRRSRRGINSSIKRIHRRVARLRRKVAGLPIEVIDVAQTAIKAPPPPPPLLIQPNALIRLWRWIARSWRWLKS